MLRRLSKLEAESIERFQRQLGIRLVNVERLYALDLPGGGYVDVFEVDRGLEYLVKIVLAGGKFPYSAGLYVGLIDKASLAFKPSIPLSFRACRVCRLNREQCFTLRSREAIRFTYGKPVRLEESVMPEGMAPVVSARGDCLGWGRPCMRNTVKYLCPQGDIGWYLRRGG
jgi:ribosome biogenesis protein Nip4